MKEGNERNKQGNCMEKSGKRKEFLKANLTFYYMEIIFKRIGINHGIFRDYWGRIVLIKNNEENEKSKIIV